MIVVDIENVQDSIVIPPVFTEFEFDVSLKQRLQAESARMGITKKIFTPKGKLTATGMQYFKRAVNSEDITIAGNVATIYFDYIQALLLRNYTFAFRFDYVLENLHAFALVVFEKEAKPRDSIQLWQQQLALIQKCSPRMINFNDLRTHSSDKMLCGSFLIGNLTADTIAAFDSLISLQQLAFASEEDRNAVILITLTKWGPLARSSRAYQLNADHYRKELEIIQAKRIQYEKDLMKAVQQSRKKEQSKPAIPPPLAPPAPAQPMQPQPKNQPISIDVDQVDKQKKIKKDKKDKKDKKKKRARTPSPSSSSDQSSSSSSTPPAKKSKKNDKKIVQQTPTLCQCKKIVNNMPSARNFDKKTIFRPCMPCLTLLAMKIDMTTCIAFLKVYNLGQQRLHKRLSAFEALTKAPKTIYQTMMSSQQMEDFDPDSTSGISLLNQQFILTMASKYALRVSFSNIFISRIAQFSKEQNKQGTQYKLTIFFPDALSNPSYGGTQQEYRWVSGSFCQYLWTSRGWTVCTGDSSGMHMFKTTLGTSWLQNMVKHIKLNEIEMKTAHGLSFDDFC